jgi:hypothetical protein
MGSEQPNALGGDDKKRQGRQGMAGALIDSIREVVRTIGRMFGIGQGEKAF